jgi:TolA-binding protein
MTFDGVYAYAAPFPDVYGRTESGSDFSLLQEQFDQTQKNTDVQDLREEIVKLRERIAVLESKVNELTKK